MAKEIKFNVRLSVDGKEQLVTATTTAKQLQDVFKGARTASDRLRDSLVSLNQGFEVIGNIASAARGLCDQFAELSRQTMSITQVTGATGEEMQHLRTEVQSVATYYGKDFAEVLRSVNALAKGFGISAGDAMRLVRDGFVSRADAGGDFLDTVREYPRYFKEAGLSAEDFIAISTNAARQGVFSDKGVDAIKEVNIRLREMTPATEAALGCAGLRRPFAARLLRPHALGVPRRVRCVGQAQRGVGAGRVGADAPAGHHHHTAAREEAAHARAAAAPAVG